MTARVKDIRERFRAAGGEDGLIDRLETQFGAEVDIPRWVDWAIDFRKRKPVSNLNGLLVTKIREVARATEANVPRSHEARRLEAERYAAFYVQLYQVVSEQALGPGSIARLLEQARRGNYPLLSTATIERLSALGETWPGG